MDKLGMNVDVIEQLAGQLATQSDAIVHLASAVDGLVARALFEWYGRGAQDFNGHWHNTYKPALLRSAASIAGLAESARRNAGEQRAISGAGRTPGSVATSLATGALGGVLAAGQFTKILDQHDLWRKIARYPHLGRLGRSLAHFEERLSGPAVHAFNTFSKLSHSAEIFGKFLKRLPGPIGLIGSVDGVITSSTEAFEAFRSGDILGGIHHGVDAFGDTLQAIPTPVTYLGGTAIKLFNTTSEGIVDAWGEPPPSWSDVARYGPSSFVDAIKTVWGDL